MVLLVGKGADSCFPAIHSAPRFTECDATYMGARAQKTICINHAYISRGQSVRRIASQSSLHPPSAPASVSLQDGRTNGYRGFGQNCGAKKGKVTRAQRQNTVAAPSLIKTSGGAIPD
jgi:hypothetical protein